MMKQKISKSATTFLLMIVLLCSVCLNGAALELQASNDSLQVILNGNFTGTREDITPELFGLDDIGSVLAIRTVSYDEITGEELTVGYLVTITLTTPGEENIEKAIEQLEKLDFVESASKLYLPSSSHPDFSDIMEENQVTLWGDANHDYRITAEDARLSLRLAAKLDSAEPVTARALDLDADGIISASDARAILRAAAKLEDLTVTYRMTVNTKYRVGPIPYSFPIGEWLVRSEDRSILISDRCESDYSAPGNPVEHNHILTVSEVGIYHLTLTNAKQAITIHVQVIVS